MSFNDDRINDDDKERMNIERATRAKQRVSKRARADDEREREGEKPARGHQAMRERKNL